MGNESIRAELKQWEHGVLGESLEEPGEREERFDILEGACRLKRLYTPLDLDEREIDYIEGIGFPGEFPYTRGIEPSGYRRRLWETTQYAGLGTATEMNERLKFLMREGLSGINLALDLPTQVGYDSDHPMSRREVGKIGVAVDSLRDMEEIFDGVPLSSLSSVRTVAASIAPIWMALLLALCEKQGVEPSSFRAVVQNDPLREFAARGTQIFPLGPSLKFTTDIVEFCASNLPTWFPLQLSDAHYHQVGAPTIDALAFALSGAAEYFNHAIARGVNIDTVAPRVEWLLATGVDFFEGIARLRAARKLWAKMLTERFGAKNPESLKLKNNGYGYGSPLTTQEPINNIIRVTIEALALALGGAQAISLPSYDEGRSIPAAEPAKVALRTQQIVAYETGVADVVDPLAGSYYVECLTDEIEEGVADAVRKIDAMGGAIHAMESGYYDRIITRGAYEDQKAIERMDMIIVGVNKFQSAEKVPIRACKVDPEVEARQIAKLKELKLNRDNRAVSKCLRDLEREARKGSNLVPTILSAVRQYTTIGEICDCLRNVWGEWSGARTYVRNVS